MAGEKPDFLRRWSQRKHQQARLGDQPAVAPAAAGSVPQLPAVADLSFDSDFKAFMHAKVEEGVKRAALKKLFADPRFNIMDGLDVYIDDYSKGEILPDEMLAKLEHAKSTLFPPQAQETAAVAKDGSEPQAESGDTQAAAPHEDHGARG